MSPSSVSDTFADEITRRTQKQESVNPDTGQAETRDSTRLNIAIKSSVDYIQQNFGDEAATSVMGIMLGAIGDDAGEEEMGNALLNTIKFIDKNFGFAAGDKVISQFNGELNEAMNEYFDNGLMERFYAGPAKLLGQGGSMTAQLNGIMNRMNEELGQDIADSIQQIIEKALEETGPNMKGLRKGVNDSIEDVRQNQGDDLADAASDMLTQGMSTFIETPVSPGNVLDITV